MYCNMVFVFLSSLLGLVSFPSLWGPRSSLTEIPYPRLRSSAWLSTRYTISLLLIQFPAHHPLPLRNHRPREPRVPLRRCAYAEGDPISSLLSLNGAVAVRRPPWRGRRYAVPESNPSRRAGRCLDGTRRLIPLGYSFLADTWTVLPHLGGRDSRQRCVGIGASRRLAKRSGPVQERRELVIREAEARWWSTAPTDQPYGA